MTLCPPCERAPMRSRSHVASNNRRSAMIRLNVNGKPGDIDVPNDTPLLWALRDVLNMTGTKFGCGAGLCGACRSEEHTSELQSHVNLVCRLLLEKKKKII